ncbi:unnamed protein product [Nezara viridula]|uniref:Neuropeptide n=1 Tax=Nezara viridula TaxID=85310 RepID=A0A9P0HF47_NEZVI|nr:unnamed protein product [Nezara viridula]
MGYNNSLLAILSVGNLVLQCAAQDVPSFDPEHPLPTVVPHKLGQHQDHTGPLDRPELLTDHTHFVSGPNVHQHHHTGFFHNVPPAPEPSVNSYIATLSYVVGLSNERIPKRLIFAVLNGKRLRGRPKRRWEDCIKADLKGLVLDGERWREVYNKRLVMSASNLRVR